MVSNRTGELVLEVLEQYHQISIYEHSSFLHSFSDSWMPGGYSSRRERKTSGRSSNNDAEVSPLGPNGLDSLFVQSRSIVGVVVLGKNISVNFDCAESSNKQSSYTSSSQSVRFCISGLYLVP